ncbi:MAG: glycoside hydrolase family 108 protein [Proteobacteria bacterium]|nr:glycoside hydrolase family 108 protein [Pseudomonadota bacterium]
MASKNFDRALACLLKHEGGYTNHPSDPGGPTNFGITIADYRKFVKRDATAADVKAMRVEQAKVIYRARYWDALACDDLPAGVDYAVFDYGVNSGIGRSGKVLRRLLGLADATHGVTDDVIAAARATDASRLVEAICDERLRFLKSLKTWGVFGNGWGRRVAEVKAAALAMASPPAIAPPPAPRVVQPVSNQPAASGLFDALLAALAAAFKRT